jgi:hypothetical protein
LDVAVKNIEGVLSAQGDSTRVAEEPNLAKVQTCVQCLCDAVALGEDGITTPLLKVFPKGIEWLHQVILAISRVGRALMAWKQALVVPLYKDKGSQQSTYNYQGISLLNILGKVYTMLLMHWVSQVVGANLHEAQCGFLFGRGL